MYSVCLCVCVCVCVCFRESKRYWISWSGRAFLQLDAIMCSVNVNAQIYCISRQFCLERMAVTL